ncbi:hypothetical protein NTE_02851 [Candidatus Nitrososphaera evergladensis SR1]|jgi:hypothetical protein|uniref:Uncharacterized protein n=1 Tax=Candidatus Nitrososphaera evergladensis SR1 TaxID=1459636 RepID=A0A075N062_9ARCH|nr:hypothetical protein [Candidatus Nitrososphaera evergladensis]AIF84889.1 hypothetical protein NTE_02851 [Candidatus Nitrososphaera evergladensis SR1]
MVSTTLYLSVALAAILAAGFAVIPAAHAQTGAPAAGGKKSLDIAIQPEWSDGANAKLNVSFYNPGTTTLHQHQDYDVVVLQNGNEIFRASKQVNQPVLHNVEGKLSVPYKFPSNGQYTVRVELLGLGLPPVPITPEHTDLSINVVPEFPAGALAAVAAVTMGGAVVVARIKKMKKEA